VRFLGRGLRNEPNFVGHIFSDQLPNPAAFASMALIASSPGLKMSALFGLVGRDFWPAAETKMASSLVWFATI
jgi:hypothetical protein